MTIDGMCFSFRTNIFVKAPNMDATMDKTHKIKHLCFCRIPHNFLFEDGAKTQINVVTKYERNDAIQRQIDHIFAYCWSNDGFTSVLAIT